MVSCHSIGDDYDKRFNASLVHSPGIRSVASQLEHRMLIALGLKAPE